MNHHLKLIVSVQIGYVILCIVWNLVGLYQLQHGQQPIGPTASMMVAVVLASFSTALFFSAKHQWKLIYLGITLLLGVGAVSAIHGALTKDLSLWPSEFWRLAGAMVNVIGALGLAMTLIYWARLWPQRDQGEQHASK